MIHRKKKRERVTGGLIWNENKIKIMEGETSEKRIHMYIVHSTYDRYVDRSSIRKGKGENKKKSIQIKQTNKNLPWNYDMYQL